MYWLSTRPYHETIIGTVIENRMEALLERCAPYIGEDERDVNSPPRFEVFCQIGDRNTFVIKDYLRDVQTTVPRNLVGDANFNIGEWYDYRLATYELGQLGVEIPDISESVATDEVLNGIQVDRNKFPTLQRNAAQVKDKSRVLPKPLIVTVNLDGHPSDSRLCRGVGEIV